MKGRLCAVRKSREAAAQAQRKVRRKASKERHEVKKDTLEHAAYVTVFTTVNRHAMSGVKVLSMYRDRWQIELVFKRLKGLVRLGSLPKTDKASCMAWLHGKLVIALLAERLYREAEFFSPWGYPSPEGTWHEACAGAVARREREFWVTEVCKTLAAHIPIRQAFRHWPTIRHGLEENPRRRQLTCHRYTV